MTRNEQALPVEQALNLFPLAGEDSLARFERLAAWFYRETGMLAPGKDEPMYGAGPESRAEREVAYGAWFSAKIERARAALSQPASGGVARETWQSINQWCDDTFGKVTVPQIIARAKEEFEELEADGANYAIEAADVVICLCRIPGFEAALAEKMAINRKRKWRLVGNGTGYHIPDAALAAPGQDEGEGS